MGALILFGYPYGASTHRAIEALYAKGIKYEYREPGPEPVHPDGSHPLGLTEMPALRFEDDLKRPIADGIAEVMAWIKDHAP